MRTLIKVWRYLKCRYCGRLVSSVGAGTNMGSDDNPMCERCYENGGDDE
jgi:hypothetical protein